MVVVADLALAGLLVYYAVRTYWSPLPRNFPPRDPAHDAVRRDFQTFKAGLLNLGWSVHVVADAEYLHLRPALLPRLLRIRPASIPWLAVTVDPADQRTYLRHATIAGVDLHIPRWCAELAAAGH